MEWHSPDCDGAAASQAASAASEIDGGRHDEDEDIEDGLAAARDPFPPGRCCCVSTMY